MQSTTSCGFCGATLRARTLQLNGHTVFAGYEPCVCEGAIRQRGLAEQAKREREQRELERAQRQAYETAGLSPRFINAQHPKAEECADAVHSGRNLYVFGDVGTLKTTLVSAVTRILVDRKLRVKLTSMWRLLGEIRAGFKDDYDPLPAYQSVQVLVLDDLGKESPTDFALERMFALVDERYNRLLPTVVTTQYRRSMLTDRLARRGDEETAKAIISRLRQGCMTVELKGGDRRLG